MGGEPTFPDKHQIANVNQRVREIGQDANRIAPENEVNAHERASGNAPVPEGHRNHTFALPFGGEPLDNETHREKGVPDETKDHEITPIQTEEPIFLPDPGDGDKCECVHKQLIDSAISCRICLDFIREPRAEIYDDAFRHAINVSAIVAGVSAMAIPAARSASIFPAAVPLPPETIAPA